MNEKKIKSIAEKIWSLEQKNDLSEMEKVMTNLALPELLEVIAYLEEHHN